MKNQMTALFLAIVIPSLASAQGMTAYHCTYGDLVRRVEIVTEPGVFVPCEVHYYKDSEAPGERQVLWSASQDAAYCEQKTSEFVGKLLGWGWTCGQGADSRIPCARRRGHGDRSANEYRDGRRIARLGCNSDHRYRRFCSATATGSSCCCPQCRCRTRAG